ncbi:methyl-accepting chemotaxis protein [Roseibium aggregatum]|uniref:HAMP domain-containing protein n=1 Tax=Roseibium aggregatum TaxID=187304 RepID=A0A939J163_9HYPH|nr:methyl-accepting chemotaxis protein [Roseibium aggregatum]MBN9671801.1 HAMP domain-containing protein [Roseibium aggregatum]
MFAGMRLSKKIPALVVGTAAVVGIGVALESYYTSASSLDELTRQRLIAAAHTGEEQFRTYFETIESELILVAENPGTASAVKDFSAAWDSMEASGPGAMETLQAAYITKNPHPVGEKDQLYNADTGTDYDTAHSVYHKWFHTLQKDHGYYDVFLFDTKGNLVYSVFKEADYATNFLTGGGEWADSDLGTVYREALEIKEHKEVAFSDFAPYGPSAGAAASFMAHPVLDKEGETVGVLAFQMPVGTINAFMRRNFGLGETGEILLVGEDRLMRNDSEFTKGVDDILVTKISSPVVDKAFQDGTAFGIDTLHRSEKLEFDAVKFDYRGVPYVLVAAQSYDAAVAPIVKARNNMFVVALGLLVIASVAAIFAARSITRPIARLVDAMERLAGGDTKVEIDGVGRSDEIGDMSKAVQVFKDNAIERLKLEQQAQNERDRERQRQIFLEDLINSFKSTISTRLATVADQMSSMRNSAETLNTLASDAQSEANSAGNASRSASENVSAVAAATEEMTATVQEIANQTEATTKIVNETVEAAEATNRNVATLSEAADHIGSVVNLIREIAAQTNLLALNATIEAARAGEAGRGFAVVAAEVKDLAEQTSKATDEISGRIGGIQTSVRDAAGAIGHIFEKVSDIKALTSSVAGAIEEQRAANEEIARSAKMASDSTGAAADNMSSVSGAVLQTSDEAGSVNASSDLVSEASDRLAEEVERFLQDVTKDVEDRRHAARKAFSQEVTVRLEDGGKRTVEFIDVSAKGAQVKDMKDVAVGHSLVFELMDGTHLSGKVVRMTEAGCGVEFTQVLQEDHALIAA